MDKYYEIEQINATGNGHIRHVILVKDPVIENGALKALQVGIPDWEKTQTVEVKNKTTVGFYIYQRPVEVIIIGNATCTEVANPVIAGNPLGSVLDMLL